MARPLFQLGPRLALCAQLVREGAVVCDVGTDHAYLPIWLIKSGKIPRALGGDISAGSLETAAGNARRYRVEDKLTLRQSDGLRAFSPQELDEVTMAGIGGELLLRVVSEAPWLRDPDKRLVLQPMSSARDLRKGLLALGYEVLEEHAVLDNGRPYSAFSARYAGGPPAAPPDPLSAETGKLEPENEAAVLYAEKVLRGLENRLEGALLGRGEETPEQLREAIAALRKKFSV